MAGVATAIKMMTTKVRVKLIHHTHHNPQIVQRNISSLVLGLSSAWSRQFPIGAKLLRSDNNIRRSYHHLSAAATTTSISCSLSTNNQRMNAFQPLYMRCNMQYHSVSHVPFHRFPSQQQTQQQNQQQKQQQQPTIYNNKQQRRTFIREKFFFGHSWKTIFRNVIHGDDFVSPRKLTERKFLYIALLVLHFRKLKLQQQATTATTTTTTTTEPSSASGDSESPKPNDDNTNDNFSNKSDESLLEDAIEIVEARDIDNKGNQTIRDWCQKLMHPQVLELFRAYKKVDQELGLLNFDRDIKEKEPLLFGGQNQDDDDEDDDEDDYTSNSRHDFHAFLDTLDWDKYREILQTDLKDTINKLKEFEQRLEQEKKYAAEQQKLKQELQQEKENQIPETTGEEEVKNGKEDSTAPSSDEHNNNENENDDKDEEEEEDDLYDQLVRLTSAVGFLNRKKGALETALEFLDTGNVVPSSWKPVQPRDSSPAKDPSAGSSSTFSDSFDENDLLDDFGIDLQEHTTPTTPTKGSNAFKARNELRLRLIRRYQIINLVRSYMIKKEVGYSVLSLKSLIPNAGRGLFCDGAALPGSILAFQPGDVWLKEHLNGNDHELRRHFVDDPDLMVSLRFDDILVDSRTAPVTILSRHDSLNASSMNPWALGHMANHPPNAILPNAHSAMINFTESMELGKDDLVYYIPNTYPRPLTWRSKVLETEPIIMHSMCLLAKRSTGMEEVTYDYRLQVATNEKVAFADWYYVVLYPDESENVEDRNVFFREAEETKG